MTSPEAEVRMEDPPQFTGSADRDDDRWLLRCVAGGDRDALATLYRRHGRIVLAQIVLVVGDRALAEEILQDTMLAVWRGAGRFRGDSAVRSWIIAIARRQARDKLRHHHSLKTASAIADLSAVPAPEAGPEETVIGRVEATAIADTVGQLGPLHREVLGLVLGAGLTMAEAAAVLQVPVGTVKSRLSAARAALARELTEKGFVR